MIAGLTLFLLSRTCAASASGSPQRLRKDMPSIVQGFECNVYSSPTTAGSSASFLSLAGELRNRIYELILLHEEPIAPWVRYNRRGPFTPGLFSANKTLHREASSVFYGQNRFDFADATSGQVVSFLERIGSNNASHIRHVLIDFPMPLYLEPGEVALEEDSVSILVNIQSTCVNLSTLTTSLSSTSSMELRLDSLDNPKVATEALELVNIRFRAISSIQEIILEVFEDGPSDHLRSIMERHGWTISTTENMEEEDLGRSFSDFDDYDYDYDYGYGGGSDDNYDIDNDSDFWRRAAD